MPAIRPHRLSPQLPVPKDIVRPEYAWQSREARHTGSHVQSSDVIERMRVAGRIAAEALREAGRAVAPGVTTDELDRIAHEYLLDHGAYPATLGYPEPGGGKHFPKSCCTSVNEVVCHGIPDLRPLEDGDIVKIDVTAYLDGVHGDTCATYFCGNVSEEARLLTERTEEAMNRGIKAVKPGRPISVIGRVIEAYAKRFGYGVVRDYTGHGVHTSFHSGLVVLHYDEPRLSTRIEEGMTFTIEPMLALGSADSHVWDDDWTVVTNDHSWVAQFEHSLVVTKTGAEILTLPGD
ncbi:MAG: type I methionyl aminopeptidase [Arachnia propionica]|nr:MAG: type I methionyl aminopeptidase [Arachnia propionica]